MLKIDDDYVLSITQHDNAVLDFSLENRQLVEGDKVLFVVKKSLSQENYDIEIQVESFENGIAKIFISEDDTSIDVGKYYYSICVHTVDGKISTVISSKLKVIAGVHK